jgi:hypothetical protein
MKKKNEKEDEKPREEPVFLEDLMPRDDVRGGSKLRFGQEPRTPAPPPPPDSKKRGR